MADSSSAVLFDIDGTLVDSTYHHAIAWQRAFDSLDIPLPLWRIHRDVGMGGDKLVADVAGDEVEEKHGDELRDRWRAEYVKIKDEVVPLPGAAELIGSLSKQGYQVALASSGDPEFSREAMETLRVADDIAALTTSEDVDASKPDPDLLQVTLDRLDGVTHAVMVGDTPYDAESAAKAGMKCIGLRSGGYSEAELVDGGVVLVVDAPEDLIDVDWEKYLSPLS
jgi:HAD superfamily hydrolase (TIGR01549 family)